MYKFTDMRNLLTILASILIYQACYSQVDVTFRPIPLLFGNMSVGADVALSQRASTELRLGVFSTSLAAKFYLNPKTRADGFYLGGFTKYSLLNQRGGVGFLLGGKVRSKNRFLFDANLCLGRSDLNLRSSSPDPILIGKVSVGWRIGSYSPRQTK